MPSFVSNSLVPPDQQPLQTASGARSLLIITVTAKYSVTKPAVITCRYGTNHEM
jgi:hypothetical protein